MSAEGMWKFQSASIDDPNAVRWGGIVVLETGRVFGGDSVMAYLGSYHVDRSKIQAKVRSWLWNVEALETVAPDEVANVFGMTGEIDYFAILDGVIDGDVITGFISPEEQPTFRLPCRMEKIADLP